MADKVLSIKINMLENDHDSESVHQLISSISGVTSVDFVMAEKTVEIHYDADQATPEDFLRALAGSGYDGIFQSSGN